MTVENKDSNTFPEVGDLVIMKDTKYRNTEKKVVYRVAGVDPWEKNGPLTTENHGTLVLELASPRVKHPAIIELVEHYCLFGWEKYFIITQKKSDIEKNKHGIQIYK